MFCSLSFHVLKFLFQLLRVIGLNELFVHGFYPSTQFRRLVYFCQTDLVLVVLIAALLELPHKSGYSSQICLCLDLCPKSFEFIDACLYGSSQLLDDLVFLSHVVGALEFYHS